MAKRKTLPKDFEQLVQTASDEDIKKVLGKCDINAYGGWTPPDIQPQERLPWHFSVLPPLFPLYFPE